MKIFLQITIQEKVEEDFRAFVAADVSGTRWELRAYGPTAVAAATEAWARFEQPVENWDAFGYALPQPPAHLEGE